jgi:hypothetical protein
VAETLGLPVRPLDSGNAIFLLQLEASAMKQNIEKPGAMRKSNP